MRFKVRAIAFILILVLAGCGMAQNSVKQVAPNNTPESSNPGVPAVSRQLFSICMVDAEAGWALTGTSVLRTTDGGETWADVTPETEAGATIAAESFLDAGKAWFTIARENASTLVVFRTANGGESWRRNVIKMSYTPLGALLNFIDTNHGWLLVHHGVAMGSEEVEVYRTVDGGGSWTLVTAARPDSRKPEDLPFGGVKNGLRFVDEQNGWMTGYSHGPDIWLYVTRDVLTP